MITVRKPRTTIALAVVGALLLAGAGTVVYFQHHQSAGWDTLMKVPVVGQQYADNSAKVSLEADAHSFAAGLNGDAANAQPKMISTAAELDLVGVSTEAHPGAVVNHAAHTITFTGGACHIVVTASTDIYTPAAAGPTICN